MGLGLGLFGGALLFLSYFGNVFVYFGIATEEERPDARRAYYIANAYWSLINIGVVILLISRSFA